MAEGLPAPHFDPADYLLPCGSPGSPEYPLQTAWKAGQKLFESHTGLDGLDLCEGSSEGLSLHSTPTACVTEARPRSPCRRRKARTGCSGDSGSSSSGGDAASCSSHESSRLEHQAQPSFTVPACARYADATPTTIECSEQDSLPGCGPTADSTTLAAAGTSPTALPADSFATPPPAPLPGSRGQGDAGSAGAWSAGSHSRAGTPASGTAAALQRQVEVLEAKLGAEAEARQALQRRLMEQRAQAEAQRQDLWQECEEKLAGLRRELAQGAAEQGAGGVDRAVSSLLGSRQQLTLGSQEQEALRRQLAEQDVLLRAYQAENEMAVARLRQQAADHQHQVMAAAEQVEELHQALAQARSERARQPPGTPGVDAARLQELLRLQGELQGVQAAAGRRERELQHQVELLGAQLQGAQGQLEQAGADAALLCQAQRQLGESDALVQQQAGVISQLEQQLMAVEGGTAGGLVGGTAAHRQHWQHLEAENASLRAALRQLEGQQAHASASQGTQQQQQQQQVGELQGKLSRLQAALALKEEQHQRQLRQLRAEHERLRVEQGIRAASRAGTARVRELEAQLSFEREASARKLRLLESRLKEAEARCAKAQAMEQPSTGSTSEQRTSAASGPALAPAQPAAVRPAGRAASLRQQQEALLAATTQLRQREQRVQRLEAELARRGAELASVRRRADTADEQANAAAQREVAAQEEAATLRGEVAALKQAIDEVAAANEGLQVQVCQVAALRRQLAVQEQQVAELRGTGERLRDAEAALADARQAQADAEAAAARDRQREMQEHAAAVQRAQQAGGEAAAAEWRGRVEAAQAEAAEWRSRVGRLEADLRSARAGLPWVPSAADYASLERRMSEVEAAAQRREARWRQLAAAAAAAAAEQQERVRAGYEGALAAKESQVGEFRRQLDGLLAAARLLHGAGGGSASVD